MRIVNLLHYENRSELRQWLKEKPIQRNAVGW